MRGIRAAARKQPPAAAAEAMLIVAASGPGSASAAKAPSIRFTITPNIPTLSLSARS